MKTFVINLASRKDRIQKFEENNADYISYDVLRAVDGYQVSYDELNRMGFDVNHKWIDPILQTPLTKGEVGCFLSHWKAWKKCIKADEPCLILEDDAIITDKFSYDDLYKLRREGYNFVYLGWKEMEKSIPINEKYVKPVYPYWGLAYMITPESAKILTQGHIIRNIIPVDEYLPQKIEELDVVAYKENVIVPRSREDGGSNIHPSSRYDYFVDFHTHVCTVATDEAKAEKLLTSAKKHQVNLINLGKDVRWEGGTMEGQGGGHKINLVKKYLSDKKDSDVFLFLDGYDTFLSDNIDEIISRTADSFIVRHDLRDRLEQPVICPVDLLQSYEVAEHIEKEYSEIFVENIVMHYPKHIVMTAAPIGQDGTFHVNCAPKESWIEKFGKHHYNIDNEIEDEIKSWGNPPDCAGWFLPNLMVYKRG